MAKFDSIQMQMMIIILYNWFLFKAKFWNIPRYVLQRHKRK